jgi:CBS domain-containing protein
MKSSELVSSSVADLVSNTRVFSPTDRASTLIGHLKETNNYEALVEEEGKTSIVTIREMLDLVDVEGTRLSKLTRRVPRLNQSNTVGDAASLMLDHRTRSIPVYREDKLLGVVTAQAIVGKALETDIKVRLSSIMTPSPIILGPASPVSTAIELMRRDKIDQIPVVDGFRLKRVVTSAQVVFNLLPQTTRDQKGNKSRGRHDDPVGMFGDDAVVTNEVTESLQSVFRGMMKRSVNYSVITNTEEVQGIVTYRDFMKLVVRKETPESVPTYIVGLPEGSVEEGVAKAKFLESVRLLMKVFPDLNEARAVVEWEGNNPQRKKNLVKVMIITPKKRYSYEVFSYDIGDSFDQVHSWVKKLIEQNKPDRRHRPSERAFSEEGRP